MDNRTKKIVAAATHAVESKLEEISHLNDERNRLSSKWNAEAYRHEIAVREIDNDQDEESVLHREVARTLRQCISDLLDPVRDLKPTSNINECPSCQRMFKDGETCPRGGCPMGGDF